ncbi:MAG: hypothetical protein IK109_03770, partial [Clostridiales bacterium]|nr:hypothetical protein [Clostridiales bacterium]
ASTAFNHLLTIPLVTVRMYSGDEEFPDEKEVIVSFGNIHDEKELERTETQFYVYDQDDSIFFRYFAK